MACQAAAAAVPSRSTLAVTSGKLNGIPARISSPLLKGFAACQSASIACAEVLLRRIAGECRQYSPADLTHAMLALEYPGGWNDVKGSTAVTVLQFLMGGGGSFSAGGPGLMMAQNRMRGRRLHASACLAFWQ